MYAHLQIGYIIIIFVFVPLHLFIFTTASKTTHRPKPFSYLLPQYIWDFLLMFPIDVGFNWKEQQQKNLLSQMIEVSQKATPTLKAELLHLGYMTTVCYITAVRLYREGREKKDGYLWRIKSHKWLSVAFWCCCRFFLFFPTESGRERVRGKEREREGKRRPNFAFDSW